MSTTRKLITPALISFFSGTALLAAIASGQAVTVTAEDTHWNQTNTLSDCPADTHWSIDLNACVPNVER
ncbi:hypothetical protein [Umezawaea sp. Da 62-37]|uniref:hypothetical protein n=1 Tax=Umezawaea sp. Da 62-37 TaxID=3075927 RepID=UPI0028F6C45B|nr:hypothetical protein [Umezawaea sp. Da 62-37]WNV86435.1 hypothetical protein RM788_51385 [Umezawaea sp. Da 62-37]